MEKYFKIEENALNDNDFVNFYETREIDLESRYLDGIEEGEKKGKKLEQVKIIKNMLKKGYDTNDISDILNLSIEEIEELKRTL